MLLSYLISTGMEGLSQDKKIAIVSSAAVFAMALILFSIALGCLCKHYYQRQSKSVIDIVFSSYYLQEAGSLL